MLGEFNKIEQMTDIGKKNKLVLVSGGSGSGKSTLARDLAESLKHRLPVLLFPMDDYYKDVSGKSTDFYKSYDFDSPDAVEFSLLEKDLRSLIAGEECEEIRYDFSTHARKRTGKARGAICGGLIVAEGIFALCNEEIRRLADLKIFIDADETLMLFRRLRRDCAERSCDPEDVKKRFFNFVMPSYRKFIAPCEKHSDLMVKSGDGPECNLSFLSAKIAELLD